MQLRSVSGCGSCLWVMVDQYTNSQSRQHLNRRHNVSSRCNKCWRSFDSRKKLNDHIAEIACQAKSQPENDRFIVASENDVDKCCDAESEEDIWWNLFRLLIPGMGSRDFDSLKSQYYPCGTSTHTTESFTNVDQIMCLATCL